MNKKLSFYSFETIRNILFYAVIIIFVFSLIPIFVISAYNHPSADDYSYAAGTHAALVNTGSLIETFKASVEKVRNTYFNWQGNFSAIFLFTLQPAVFGDNYYFLSTIILVTSFIASNLFFSYQLFVRYFQTDKKTWIIVSLIITGLSMQFLVSPVQGFYWYNGAIYYTFFYSLSLVLFGIIIGYLLNNDPKMKKKIWFSLPLAFFIGGGNFVTSLITCVLIALLCLYLRMTKNSKGKLLLVILLACLIAFGISFTAPGNAIRQAYFTKTPVLLAIFKSFIHAGEFILYNPAALPTVLGVAIVIPFLTQTIRNTRFKFERPLIAFLISFCVFSAHFAPTIYSMGNNGPLRLQNLYYYAYIWLILFNMSYFSGWAYHKLETMHTCSKMTLAAFNQKISNIYKKLLVPVLGILLILFAITFFLADFTASTTSVSAGLSLLSGEAQQYDKEYNARLQLLNSSELNNSISPFSVKPFVLFQGDIANPPDWTNHQMEKFFQKETITLE